MIRSGCVYARPFAGHGKTAGSAPAQPLGLRVSAVKESPKLAISKVLSNRREAETQRQRRELQSGHYPRPAFS